MTFSSTQIRNLQRDLKDCDVRTRAVNGRDLLYIEGWHAISEANRIFGFDGWNRETTELRCIHSRENRGTWHVVYMAKVRITVRAEHDQVVRESFGTGEAHGASPGEAHEKALKTAETDATKRVFATFGKPFGLSLYLGKRREGKPEIPRPDIERRRTLQKLSPTGRYFVPSRPNTNLLDQLKAAPDQADKRVADSDTPSADSDGAVSALAAVPAPTSETSIAPSPMLIEHPRRRRNAHHLKFVANQPCLVCSRTPSDAHHLKFAQPHALSRKVSDEYTVPLCRTHHRQLHHGGNEIGWWIDMDIDPLPIARSLWEQSQNQNNEITLTAREPHGQ